MLASYSVHCTSCETTFPVDPEKVPPEGVQARCSVCEAVFLVERPGEEGSADTSKESPIQEGTTQPGRRDRLESPEEDPESLEEDPEPLAEPEEEPAPSEEDPEPLAEPEEEPMSSEEVSSAGADPVEASEEDLRPEPEAMVAQPFFGERTPEQMAEQWARVFVSDIVDYNDQLHQKALKRGTLKEDFAGEIEKAWEEYVAKVGVELAESTPSWRKALNDFLAKGEEIF